MDKQSIIITHLKKKVDKITVFMKPDSVGKKLTHTGIFLDADETHFMIYDTYKSKNKFLLFIDIAEIQSTNITEIKEVEVKHDNN